MAKTSVLGVTVDAARPTDGSASGDAADKLVSSFITIQSLANFSAMTGAVAAAWGGAKLASDNFSGRWFPLMLCLTFGLVSLATSQVGRQLSKWIPAVFIAGINSLTLFSAVIGAAAAAAEAPL